MSYYRLIPVDLPAWERFSHRIVTELETRRGETAAFTGVGYFVWLPEALHSDISRLAKQVTWTQGQLLGYLVLQGVLRLSENNSL